MSDNACYQQIDGSAKKNAPRSTSHGTLIEPLPREAHKEAKLQGRISIWLQWATWKYSAQDRGLFLRSAVVYITAGEVCTRMQGETKERWMQLAEAITVEQNPQRLLALVKELNDLLAQKERRLGIIPPPSVGGVSTQ